MVAAIGGAALAVATGLPPLYDIVQGLPGFEATRNGRLAVITVLCVAMLAGWALDDLTAAARVPARRARMALAIGAGLFALPIAIAAGSGRLDLGVMGDALRVAWGFVTPSADLASAESGELGDIIRLASLLEWVVLAGAALALLVLRLRGRLRPAAFVALAALLVVADLFKAGMGYNPAIAEEHAEQPTTPAVRFLQSQRPARFAGLEPTAPISLAVPMSPSVAMRYHVYDARGYDYPVEERYAELWRRAITPSTNCNYAFCPSRRPRRPERCAYWASSASPTCSRTAATARCRDFGPPTAGPTPRSTGIRGRSREPSSSIARWSRRTAPRLGGR